MSTEPQQPPDQRYAGLDLLHLPVWVFDIDQRRVHWANPAALKVWNAPTLQALRERDMERDMSASVARRLAQYQIDFATQGAAFNEQWTLYPDGMPVSLNVHFSGHRLPDGRMAMLCQARPAQAESPDALRAVEALLHTAVMISLYDAGGVPVYRNPAARSSVRTLDEPLTERFADLDAAPRLLAAVARQGTATLTLAVHTAQGERWHEVSARRCRDAATGADAVLVSEVDVTALKETEARAQFLAMHDTLTGLPNRSQVMSVFSQALAEIRQRGGEAALLFIDLDNFKDVNDTLGHAAGDQLLVHIAGRLRSATRAADRVARLGGDEFLIMVTSDDIRHEVGQVHQRIMATLAQPLSIGGATVHVTPTLGVSLYPRDGTDLDTLLRHADLAMYAAKERGRNALAFYEPDMGVAVRERTTLEAELRLALERGEFEVHYQPRVAVSTQRIVGAEALVRWRHPQRGLVLPDVFIPLCESTGLIRPLGLWVFEQAVRQQVAWSAAGHDLQVAVNLSPRQFADARLASDLQGALAVAGCDPRRMEVEITESVLVGSDDKAAAALLALRQLGLSIALDDFGTGYSNLAYLQRYPIQTLKIDKTFIHGLESELPLAEMIVSLCRLMDLRVVAEGVETAAQLDWVQRRDIDEYQGHLFAPALPADAFSRLLQR